MEFSEVWHRPTDPYRACHRLWFGSKVGSPGGKRAVKRADKHAEPHDFMTHLGAVENGQFFRCFPFQCLLSADVLRS